jgi:metal-responsive CopG/Arc/MetJ family transcriptional regulator
METISLKLDEHLLNNIDTNLKKHNFSTRTEFIRTAIRNQLEKLNKDELINEFMKYKGKGKSTSDKQRIKTREKVFYEMLKEKNWLD